MSFTVGTRLGSYEILSLLGAGGMGEVYRGRDLKLGRDVAIKILPDQFASDAERVARFEREARTLAALNHPHIAQIYGFEQAETTSALVMELVEGEDLSQRIVRGPIPLDEALPIAKQIADALDAAHEQGIIHRDLKPANIMVRADGTVKVLDFGLAKAMDGGSAAPSSGATITTPAMSMHGVILGTAAYMAPEQAKGRPVDKRADIWAFGCVLYEMLTGARAFAGDDISETIASILRSEPEWSSVPSTLKPLLVNCLQKDPRRRLRDIGDARLVLENEPAPASAHPHPQAPARSSRLALIGWMGFGVTAAAAIWIGWSPRPPSAPSSAIISSLDQPLNATGYTTDRFAVSPDGQRLAFVAPGASGANVLWIRPFSSLNAQPLTGTDGASAPFWSPDSQHVGFTAAGRLKRIDLIGGAPVTLAANVAASPGTWNRDGIILFCARDPREIFRVPAAGGTAAAASGPAASIGNATYYPFFLPDRQHFLFLSARILYVGSLNDSGRVTLLEDVGNAAYSLGHLIYLRESTLYAQKFDAERLRLDGSAVPIAEQVQINSGSGAGAFSVSDAGVLAYQMTRPSRSKLVWFDRGGRELGGLGEADRYGEASLSADGSRVAVSIFGESNDDRDIWVFDVSRGTRTRVTSDRADDSEPLLSPDGSRVAYSSRRGAVKGVYVRDLAVTAGPRLLIEDGFNKVPTSWSTDGQHIVYSRMGGVSGFDLWSLPISSGAKPTALLQSSAGEYRAELSPDGRWLAYESNESGRSEVYVSRYPLGGEKWTVSSSGGEDPHWQSDGGGIFFVSSSALMYTQATATATRFDIGKTERLFDLGPRLPRRVTGYASNIFDVSPDGQRFLFSLPEYTVPDSLTLVVNWPALVRDVAPR